MFPEKKMDPLTKDEWREYNRATRCHICMEYFDEESICDRKVRDHCHYTGKFRVGCSYDVQSQVSNSEIYPYRVS